MGKLGSSVTNIASELQVVTKLSNKDFCQDKNLADARVRTIVLESMVVI